MHRPNMNIYDLIGFVILSPFQQIVGFFKCVLRKFLLLLLIWNGQKIFKYVADYKRIKLIFKKYLFFSVETHIIIMSKNKTQYWFTKKKKIKVIIWWLNLSI